MLILLQIDVVAKIFDPNPWNFYTKIGAEVLFKTSFRTIFACIETRWYRFLISILAWNTMQFSFRCNFVSACSTMHVSAFLHVMNSLLLMCNIFLWVRVYKYMSFFMCDIYVVVPVQCLSECVFKCMCVSLFVCYYVS